MSGVLAGLLGLALAAGGGVLFWRRLRKNQREKITRLAPITVQFAPRAPRAHLALPPADLPPEQDQAWPPGQAPWEQDTVVDMLWTPAPPSAEYRFQGQGEYPYSQDPQQHLSQLRIQDLPPVENPFLEEDQVQRPPWTPGSPPPAMPAPGQSAAQHPDPAQHPHPDAL